MVRYCSVVSCHNKDTKNLHVFPKDGTRRRKWLDAFHMSERDITSNSRVCDRHFNIRDYDQTPFHSTKKRLNSDAVPMSSFGVYSRVNDNSTTSSACSKKPKLALSAHTGENVQVPAGKEGILPAWQNILSSGISGKEVRTTTGLTVAIAPQRVRRLTNLSGTDNHISQDEAIQAREELSAIRTKLKKAEDEVVRARGKLSAIRTELKHSEDEVVQAREELSAIRTELKNAEDEVALSYSAVAASNLDLRNARQEAKKAQAEIKSLQEEIAVSRAEAELATDELQAATDQLQAKENQLQLALKDAQAARAVAKAHQTEAQIAKSKLGAAALEAQALRRKIAHLEKEIAEN